MNKERSSIDRGINLFIILLLISALAIFFFLILAPQRESRNFSEFEAEVRSGKVASAKIYPNAGTVVYKNEQGEEFLVRVASVDNSLAEYLSRNGITVEVVRAGLWQSNLGAFAAIGLIALVMLLFWSYYNRQIQSQGQQAFAFGKSRAKVLIDNKPRTNFDDVAGMDEAKEELKEVIDFLKNPERFRRVGAKVPKGVLLVGPPGCGKTLLARAVAGEASVPFIHISGSEFVELFVGVGASRVRDLFATAERQGSCVVFIDEIDAVGRQRGAGLGGGHDEREQTLNQLLVEMDGFDPNKGIVVLAATNRPDILDPALLRPGRFDRRVIIDRPDLKGRIEIMKVHLRNVPTAPDIDVQELAHRTPGFTGADLANMVNEAAILAARENKTRVEMHHFHEAIERVLAGPQRKSRIISEKEKKVVAYHEAGHALLGWVLPNADSVHKISVIPRGLAMGYTMHLPEEDRYLMSRADLMDKMTVLIGGRVSEELTFHEISTGAQNDLEELTELARRMVKEFGMSPTLGPITYGKHYGPVFLGRDIATERDYSEQTALLIDQEIKKIVEFIYHRAKSILFRYLEQLHSIAEELYKKENIEKEAFEKLVASLGIPKHAPEFAFSLNDFLAFSGSANG